MNFARSVLAEWPLLRVRLLRTRLGLWLLLLTGALIVTERHARAPDPLATALQAGALAAVLAVGYLAGSAADRAAVGIVLLHPSTPWAVTCGRWLAAVGGAGLVVFACVIHSASETGAVPASLGAMLSGLGAAAAIAAPTLALAWTGGNVMVGLWLLNLALIGGAPPEALLGHVPPGALRYAAVLWLELTPGQWHFRGIGTGDVAATALAAAWVGLGLVAARWRVARVSRMR